DRQELRDGDDVATKLLAARDAFELAELLQRIEPHIGVGADAQRDPVLANAGDGEEAIPEVRLRKRADADARAGLREQGELVLVGVRAVDDRRPRPETAGSCQELDRADAVL